MPVVGQASTPKPALKPAVATKPPPPSKVVVGKGGQSRSNLPQLKLPVERTQPIVGFKDYISCFYSQPGAGKTTFVNSLAKRVLIVSTDRGTRFMPTTAVECLSWEQHLQVLESLEAGQAKNYDLFAIDHVADWAFHCEEYVLNKLGIDSLADAKWGKGWSSYKREINGYMQRIKRLNLGLVFIAHETTETVKVRTEEITKVKPNMPKQAWDAIVPLVDIVGRLAVVTAKGADGKLGEMRVLETWPRADLYVKDRTKRKKPSPGMAEPLNAEKFLASFNSQS